MKSKSLLLCLSILVLSFVAPLKSNAQALKTLSDNGLWGSGTGITLAFATNILQDNHDTNNLRVGLGAGILFGIGMGVWDLYQMGTTGNYAVNGMFSTATSTSGILGLDMIYGAISGALIGVGVQLVADGPVLDGVKTGGAIGAWGGFAFGLVDAFILSRSSGGGYFLTQSKQPIPVKGMIKMQPSENVAIGFVSPEVYQQFQVNQAGITTGFTSGVNFANLNIRF